MDTVERLAPDKPGLEGFSFEDAPRRVQGAQPHPDHVLRVNETDDGVQFPAPGIQIDAHIGDAKRR